MSNGNWFVYLIAAGSRTYVGSTTDVARRLRQHNGEIVGGARSTRKLAGKWRGVAFLAGFLTRSSACRWEALVKKRARGREARLSAMLLVSQGVCPQGRHSGLLKYDVPDGITLAWSEP